MKKTLLDARDLERHATRCTICRHPQLDEIEKEFVSWTSVGEIVKEFGIPERSSIYRHARATGLFEKRDRNIKLALGKIVERAGDIVPNANAIVAAAVALAKINTDGRYIERREVLSLTPVFERMTARELEDYASTGTLPVWAQSAVADAKASM
jgi:hypothetical protein